MSESKLRFVTEPYHLGHIENYVLHFREQGYVVLPDVFERESVDEYLTQIQAALVPGKNGRMELPPSPLRIAPTRAPRIRQVVKSAFSTGAMVPNVSLFEVAWLIAPAEAPGSIAGHWHKDRDHRCVSCAHGYCPGDIHVGMYFMDMTQAHGPTQVIARSHRDINRTPFGGCEPDSFLCRKQDAVMWDQRLWRRATRAPLKDTVSSDFSASIQFQTATPKRIRWIRRNARHGWKQAMTSRRCSMVDCLLNAAK